MSISDLARESAIIATVVEQIDYCLKIIIVPIEIFDFIDRYHVLAITEKIYCRKTKGIELILDNDVSMFFETVEELQIFVDRLIKLKVMV